MSKNGEFMDLDQQGSQPNEGNQNSVESELRKHHLNFAAAHEARHAARQQSIARITDADCFHGKPKEESITRLTEALKAEQADISASLSNLLAERRDKAAASGSSGVSHATSAPSAASSDIEIGPRLDVLVDRVKGLRQRTAEATMFLPPYDVRRAHEEAEKLLADVESTRAELAPRRKFSFRSRRTGPGRAVGTGGDVHEGSAAGDKTSAAKVKATEGGVPACVPNVLRFSSGSDDGGTQDVKGLGLYGITGADIKVPERDAHKDKDFNLSELNQCKVFIPHVLGALRLRRLSSCRVICGPVRGPIYVEGCSKCVVVASGRQLRIHATHAVDFYIHVASGPIIEDCTGLRFAPATLQYPLHGRQLEEIGLSDTANAWGDVKDFKWHRAQKSPNWSIVPEVEREVDYHTSAV